MNSMVLLLQFSSTFATYALMILAPSTLLSYIISTFNLNFQVFGFVFVLDFHSQAFAIV
jgi:hypothetical protein